MRTAQPRRWTPADYRGLTVGRSHLPDALQLFGAPDLRQPSHSLLSKGGDELIYRGRGDHKGDLAVRADRFGLIVEIQESLPVAIPRTRIYKEFGFAARTAHYSIARCAGDLLYRDPSGALELTLYPQRGIVVWPDQYGYDFAAILYLARQPGANDPPACALRH